MPENAVFIFDGPNFYKNIKRVGLNRKDLDFRKLAFNLSQGRNIVDVIYFTSPIDRRTDPTNYANQQKFFVKLHSSQVTLKLGNLVNRAIRCPAPACGAEPAVCDSCKKTLIVKTEKSVDVQIAMEMVLGCINNTFDCLYLASCDSDLVPAINFIKNQGKKVFLLLPANNGTLAKGHAVSKACNVTIPIDQPKIDAAQYSVMSSAMLYHC